MEGFHKVLALKELGWLRECRYSAFAAYTGSDIRLHPESFGIRRLICPPTHDLDPDLTEFEADGMSRRTVRRLCRQFWTTLFARGGTVPGSVEVPGRVIPLRFDLARIGSLLNEQAEQTVVYTLTDWLDSCGGRVEAIQAKGQT